MTQDSPTSRDAAPGSGPVLFQTRQGPATAVPAQDFHDALLAALTQMAALSPRRQADVAVAMRRAALATPADGVAPALDRLRADGCIEQPLHLSDGGILVSVTMRGIERLAATSHRHVVAALMAGTPG